MNPGLLDRQIKLAEPTQARDSLGEPVASWATYATVWARKIHRSARTADLSGKDTPLATKIYRIRYRDDIRTDHRLTDQFATYKIDSINEIGRRQYLDLICLTIDSNQKTPRRSPAQA